MKYKKNNSNKDTKLNLNNVKEPKNSLSHTKIIYNGFGITYFTIMLIIIAFMFMRDSSMIDSTSVFLFLGFFILMFILGFKLKMSKKDIIMNPIKIFILIIGIVYLFEFTTTGINNFGLISADSVDIYDIEHNNSKVFEGNDSSIYFKADNPDVYIINQGLTTNKVSKFQLYKESDFDKETLKITTKFYDLSTNVKFAYIVGNQNNEIILQITNNNKRYLAKVIATGFVKYLEEKDSFIKSTYSTKDFAIFVDEGTKFIAYFDIANFSVSEFDKIKSIKDTNYIQRGFAFLSNHYSSEYLQAENMSIELVSEKNIDNDKIKKINLYSIRSKSSSGFFGMSDVMEIIYKDGSSNIGIVKANTILMKEGVEFEG